ncbi:MAG: ribonuclease PH [Lentisphaerae bacterium]|nr:ribonuclease PH [Lentisphaerota bacterium]MCP4100947.1 ribonuclease PH [Lentisphaerota bacterium]
MKRVDGRDFDQLRKLKITQNYLAHPLSSVMIEFGGTKVVCAVSVENRIPGWMRAQNVPGGWLTCEYGMLPASTHDRMRRESSSGKQGGRTVEIQRLIGRSLRGVMDLKKLGQNTIYIDCDVVDADGGTRCAGITGAATALQLAINSAYAKRNFKAGCMQELVGAVSVGIVDGKPVLDLCYEEDCNAEVDMNVVMTESGKFIEVQGTAEGHPFSRSQFNEMLELAESGLKKIFEIQRKVINGNSGSGSSSKGTKKRIHPNQKLGSLGDVFGDVKI